MREYEVLVIGGGPAGISAAITAGESGVNVLMVEEREKIGGQLLKQTHKFFGSKEERAGVRGIKIAEELEEKIKSLPNIEIMTNTTAAGYYEDGVVSLVNSGKMIKIKSKKVIVATGAFERFLPFENNDLPGVYGAGAIQTLMNVYGIYPGKKVLMIGSGNIGLIVSYQLAQAGVDVVGIIEALPEISGYLVHASKIRRMGIPIWTSHTIEKAVGTQSVEGAVIYQLNEKWEKINGSERQVDCDVICLAVGLSPLIDLLVQAGCEMRFVSELGGFIPYRNEMMLTSHGNIYVAGDISGIEEASTAMLEGQLAGYHAAYAIKNDPKIYDKVVELKDRLATFRAGPASEKIRKGLSKLDIHYNYIEYPDTYNVKHVKKYGIPHMEDIETKVPNEERLAKGPVAIVECFQHIPCDSCADACSFKAIKTFDNINDSPEIEFEKCTGCSLCVAKCPGLAIFVVNRDKTETTSEIMIPYEFVPLPEKGEVVNVYNREGERICEGKIIRNIVHKDKTNIVSVEVPKEHFMQARHIRKVEKV